VASKLFDSIRDKAAKIRKELHDATTKSQIEDVRAQIKTLRTMESEYKKAVDSSKTYQAEATQDLQQLYSNFLQANQQAFGTLFQGPFVSGPQFSNMTQWGLMNKFGQATPRPTDLLKDLREQVGQFQTFRHGLATLRRRGLPASMIAEIQSQGVAAVPDIQALEKMSKGQLKTYGKLWTQGQRDIVKATKIDFAPELKKWKVYGREIAKAIAQGISENDFTMFNNLKSSILRELRGTHAPSGGRGGHRGTAGTHATGHTTAYHYHVHTDHPDKAMTELRHMNFRMRNSIFV
jgi:hypothetical protein